MLGEEKLSIVYDPSRDVGSLAFHERAYRDAPTFVNARVLRDRLLEEGRGKAALQHSVDYRGVAPGPDADWLVGDCYRALGDREPDPAARVLRFQEALCQGLLAFYRAKVELDEDRLLRWNDARDWMTERSRRES